MVSFGPACGPRPQFDAGRLVATPGVLMRVPQDEIDSAVSRHLQGDWGELEGDDWHMNDRALRIGGRIFSVYQSSSGTKFWIITEADRTATSVLLPEEY